MGAHSFSFAVIRVYSRFKIWESYLSDIPKHNHRGLTEKDSYGMTDEIESRNANSTLAEECESLYLRGREKWLHRTARPFAWQ